MKVLDLFSGIGGFSLGLERAGMETVAFCEIDPFCRKVLKKHWPGVPIYEDVTSHRFEEDVDLVTAGFPCQDISLAGEGAGLSGDRSGLFWYVLRTLCMVGRPRVLLQNVASLLSRGLSSVLGALASLGYDAEWHCIPASRVGAQHLRDRIWIVADPVSWDNDSDRRSEEPSKSLGQDAAHHCGKRLSRRCHTRTHRGNERELQPRYRFAFSPETAIPRDYWNHQPVLGGRLHGVPDRPHRIRALGNSVVPQIPELIGRAILDHTAPISGGVE